MLLFFVSLNLTLDWAWAGISVPGALIRVVSTVRGWRLSCLCRSVCSLCLPGGLVFAISDVPSCFGEAGARAAAQEGVRPAGLSALLGPGLCARVRAVRRAAMFGCSTGVSWKP